MPVELGLSPDTLRTVAVDEVAAAARDAGFTALGLEASHVDERAKTTLSQAGLRCHELLALLFRPDEEAVIAEAHRIAEAVAQVGAEWVLSPCRAPRTAETATLIARCAALFAEAGAGMAVEFSPFGSLKSIEAALGAVDAAGVGRAGVVIDTWHFFRCGCAWDQLSAIPLDRIAYVQFTDALAPISDDEMDETMNHRGWPGDGLLDLHRFAGTLLDRGWAGVVSVEVLSATLRELPVQEFARLAHDSAARYWLGR